MIIYSHDFILELVQYNVNVHFIYAVVSSIKVSFDNQHWRGSINTGGIGGEGGHSNLGPLEKGNPNYLWYACCEYRRVILYPERLHEGLPWSGEGEK